MSEQEEVKQSYHVTVEVLQTHSYVIDDVNSPEEAEQVAEEYYNDGEPGTVEGQEIYVIDSYPVEKEEIN